ncbi:MAG: metal-dependent hydrolase [Planctomycetes bacterium]|nr:metal-dependent hydrolase [Planctomycetota bacterium]
MSSTFGHTLAAFAAYEAVRGEETARRWPWVFVAVANLPDLDVPLAALLGGEWVARLSLGGESDGHHGFTHTLFFALVAATAAFLLARRGLPRPPRARVAVALALTALLHPVLDWGVGRGVGIRFFWPLADHRYFCAWPFVPTAYYGHSLGEFVRAQFGGAALAGFALEAVIFGPWWCAARRRSAPAVALAALVSAAGLLAAHAQALWVEN